MNLTDMIYNAEVIVKESYDRPTWESMIISVLSELNSSAKLSQTAELVKQVDHGKTEVNLESDIPDLYELLGAAYKYGDSRKRALKQLPYYNTVSTGWVKDDANIYFQGLSDEYEECTIYVYYYELLKIIPDGNDRTFNLPEEHHDVILKGLMSKVAQREEDYNRRMDFYNEYIMAKRDMLAKRIADTEPWHKQFVLPLRMGV